MSSLSRAEHQRTPVHVSSSPHLPVSCMPPLLLLSLWLSESSWGYLLLVSLSSQSTPNLLFTPAAVLIPFAMAIITTLLLGIISRQPRASLAPTDPALGAQNSPLRPAVAGLFVAIQLMAGMASLSVTTWWELYRAHPLLDLSWPALALADTRGPANSIPALAWLMVGGLLLWWRGSQLAREEVDFPSLLTRFLVGAGGLVTLATFGATAPLGMPADTLLMGACLLFGLVSLAIARLEATRRDRLGTIGPHWGWQASILALLLLIGGFAFGLLLMPALGDLAHRLWDELLLPLLGLLLELLKWIAHLLGWDQPPEPSAIPAGGTIQTPSGERDNPFILPEWIRDVARLIFNLCWIAVILGGIYSWVRAWRSDRRGSPGTGPHRTRIPWSPRLLLGAIRAWLLQTLLAIWPALRRWLLKNDSSKDAELPIRLLYRRLLAWGASHGAPREGWSTPREYQKTLSERWPDLSDSLAVLTNSYLRARYGSLDLDEAELEAARTGWQHIAGRADSAPPQARP